jgi:hypothetical protein
MKEAYDHHRVSPEGRAAGWQNATLYDKAEQSLGAMADPDERCKTCAFRVGTVPNGCEQTQLDVLKCVIEQKPFHCHQHGQVCHGWFTVSVALAGKIPAGTTAPWPMSPPDSQRHIVDAAEAKRERRAKKLRKLAKNGAIESVLPDGLWRRSDGTLMYECVSCEQATEWPLGIAEFDINKYDLNLCGRSPRCCP